MMRRTSGRLHRRSTLLLRDTLRWNLRPSVCPLPSRLLPPTSLSVTTTEPVPSFALRTAVEGQGFLPRALKPTLRKTAVSIAEGLDLSNTTSEGGTQLLHFCLQAVSGLRWRRELVQSPPPSATRGMELASLIVLLGVIVGV